MNKNDLKDDIFNIDEYKNRVHKILAHSYSAYFILFLIGVFFDLLFKFKIKILNFSFLVPVGALLIGLSSLLIFWAQSTSRKFNKETLTKESFCNGPYAYTRTPTHWGLFFLMLGFGILANAIFIIISTVISFLLTKFIYLRKEEAILEKKYGAPYLEYKKAVKI